MNSSSGSGAITLSGNIGDGNSVGVDDFATFGNTSTSTLTLAGTIYKTNHVTTYRASSGNSILITGGDVLISSGHNLRFHTGNVVLSTDGTTTINTSNRELRFDGTIDGLSLIHI